MQTLHLPFDVPLPPFKMLSTGRLTCMYENGNLRYIRLGNTEVVRMIYSAVRNANWETAPYEIRDEVIEENEAGFAITYTAFYELNGIHYNADFQVEGKDGCISFSMKGVALSSFQTNRIGVCVHHPIRECAGKKVEVIDPDGNSYEATFPVLISPHQPFKGVQEMQWSTEDGITARLAFEGDVFETEDQRNWTDASYKTYSRPLELPFPYSINEGETIEQKVTLKVPGVQNAGSETASIPSSLNEIKVPFPKIGYCRPKDSKRLSEAEIKLLQKVPFDHYRVELHMDESGWQEELSKALSEAGELATKLELAILFDEEYKTGLSALIKRLQAARQRIASILISNKKYNATPEQLLQQVYPVLKQALRDVKIGYGTNGFFAELNRNRPKASDYDFVSFSVNPQVHAVDTRSLIENLDAQADTIETARTFSAGKPVHVAPITFKIRSDSGKDVDERLHTSFGAYWTLQAIKNLSAANSLTFYETVGAKGIINERNSSSAQSDHLSEPLLTPLYKVLAAVKAFEPLCLIQQDRDQGSFIIENNVGDRLMFVTEQKAFIKRQGL